MKKLFLLVQLTLITSRVYCQGMFIYDQQSSDENHPGESLVGLTSFQQPVGQSFTPSLSSVSFIRLELFDGDIINGSGATILIHLRTNSITGPIVTSTMPVFLPNGFNGGFTNFFFSTPTSLIPGTLYYFQPVIQSGDNFGVGRFVQNYLGGTEYFQGQPGNNDLWFREGIVVPEPSSALLVLLGGVVVARRHRKRQRTG